MADPLALANCVDTTTFVQIQCIPFCVLVYINNSCDTNSVASGKKVF